MTRLETIKSYPLYEGEPNNYHRRYRCYASRECYLRAMDAYRPGRSSR